MHSTQRPHHEDVGDIIRMLKDLQKGVANHYVQASTLTEDVHLTALNPGDPHYLEISGTRPPLVLCNLVLALASLLPHLLLSDRLEDLQRLRMFLAHGVVPDHIPFEESTIAKWAAIARYERPLTAGGRPGQTTGVVQTANASCASVAVTAITSDMRHQGATGVFVSCDSHDVDLFQIIRHGCAAMELLNLQEWLERRVASLHVLYALPAKALPASGAHFMKLVFLVHELCLATPSPFTARWSSVRFHNFDEARLALRKMISRGADIQVAALRASRLAVRSSLATYFGGTMPVDLASASPDAQERHLMMVNSVAPILLLDIIEIGTRAPTSTMLDQGQCCFRLGQTLEKSGALNLTTITSGHQLEFLTASFAEMFTDGHRRHAYAQLVAEFVRRTSCTEMTFCTILNRSVPAVRGGEPVEETFSHHLAVLVGTSDQNHHKGSDKDVTVYDSQGGNRTERDCIVRTVIKISQRAAPHELGHLHRLGRLFSLGHEAVKRGRPLLNKWSAVISGARKRALFSGRFVRPSRMVQEVLVAHREELEKDIAQLEQILHPGNKQHLEHSKTLRQHVPLSSRSGHKDGPHPLVPSRGHAQPHTTRLHPIVPTASLAGFEDPLGLHLVSARHTANPPILQTEHHVARNHSKSPKAVSGVSAPERQHRSSSQTKSHVDTVYSHTVDVRSSRRHSFSDRCPPSGLQLIRMLNRHGRCCNEATGDSDDSTASGEEESYLTLGGPLIKKKKARARARARALRIADIARLAGKAPDLTSAVAGKTDREHDEASAASYESILSDSDLVMTVPTYDDGKERPLCYSCTMSHGQGLVYLDQCDHNHHLVPTTLTTTTLGRALTIPYQAMLVVPADQLCLAYSSHFTFSHADIESKRTYNVRAKTILTSLARAYPRGVPVDLEDSMFWINICYHESVNNSGYRQGDRSWHRIEAALHVRSTKPLPADHIGINAITRDAGLLVAGRFEELVLSCRPQKHVVEKDEEPLVDEHMIHSQHHLEVVRLKIYLAKKSSLLL